MAVYFAGEVTDQFLHDIMDRSSDSVRDATANVEDENMDATRNVTVPMRERLKRMTRMRTKTLRVRMRMTAQSWKTRILSAEDDRKLHSSPLFLVQPT